MFHFRKFLISAAALAFLARPSTAFTPASLRVHRASIGRRALAEDSTAAADGADVPAPAEAEAVAAPKPKERKQRVVTIPASDLAKGSEYTGKVSSVVQYGAFVDIGSERDVLVHVSEIANEYVSDVSSYCSQGDEVTLKLLDIGADGKLQGTFMVDDAVREAWMASRKSSGRGGGNRQKREKKDVSAFADLDIREFYEGTVQKVIDAGCFVSVESVSPGTWGWLHVSNIALEGSEDDFIEKAPDAVKAGDKLQVRVFKCEVEEANLVFSMKPFKGRSRGGGGRRGGPPMDANMSAAMREALSAEVDNRPTSFPPPRNRSGPRRPRNDDAAEESSEPEEDWEKEYEAFQEQQSKDGPSFSIE